MTSVVDIASVLREGDIKALCVEFNIPSGMAWRAPVQSDRAMAPPAGHIAIYEAHLRSGLRLPMPTELESILKALSVPVAQLHANAVRYICTLCIFARKLHQKFRMSGVRVLFKLNRGSEWKSLSPRPGIKINKAIHDSLKNWKNRFFFVKVGEKWPLARDWGEIPEAYFGTPSVTERSAWSWLLKAIEDNPEEFKRDFLVSRAEIRKANWGPPSPTQKTTPPSWMMSPDESKGILIRERAAEEPERAARTPSSSSSHFDYIAAGFCRGVGGTSGVGGTVVDSPMEAGVILAQPAVRVTPGAAWLESAEEPARDVPEGSRAYIIGSPGVGPPADARRAFKGKRPASVIDHEAVGEEPAGDVFGDPRVYTRQPPQRTAPPAAVPKAARSRKPAAAATPEAAREEPAAAAGVPEAAREDPTRDVLEGSRVYAREPSRRAVSLAAAPKVTKGQGTVSEAILGAAREDPAIAGEPDEFTRQFLEEAAASSAPGDSRSPPLSGSYPQSRPRSPTKKFWDPLRVSSAVYKAMVQRDEALADQAAEIAGLKTRLVASEVESQEKMVALDAVLSSTEAKCASLELEVARLKEQNDQLNLNNKRIADRAAAFESELSTRLRPHEIGGALHARLLDGINIGRRVARLVDPAFPVEFINQRNSSAQRKEDLVVESREVPSGPPAL